MEATTQQRWTGPEEAAEEGVVGEGQPTEDLGPLVSLSPKDSLACRSARCLATCCLSWQDSWVHAIPSAVLPELQRHLSREDQVRFLQDVRQWHATALAACTATATANDTATAATTLWCHERFDEEGRPHGLCSWWYPNGQPWRRERYSHGVKHGASRWWHPNGRPRCFMVFERGEERREHTKMWTESGTLRSM
ncbi:hypothetical protein QOT17_010939 [Balamuthia mandrillaris]